MTSVHWMERYSRKPAKMSVPENESNLVINYARHDPQAGEMDANGNIFEPETEPNLGQFIANQFKANYGESQHITPETGYLLRSGYPVKMGEGGVRGEDHRGAVPTVQAMIRWKWPEKEIREALQGNRGYAMLELMKRSGAARIHVSPGMLYVHHETPLSNAQKEALIFHVGMHSPAKVTFDHPGGRTAELDNPTAEEMTDYLSRSVLGHKNYARPKKYARMQLLQTHMLAPFFKEADQASMGALADMLEENGDPRHILVRKVVEGKGDVDKVGNTGPIWHPLGPNTRAAIGITEGASGGHDAPLGSDLQDNYWLSAHPQSKSVVASWTVNHGGMENQKMLTAVLSPEEAKDFIQKWHDLHKKGMVQHDPQLIDRLAENRRSLYDPNATAESVAKEHDNQNVAWAKSAAAWLKRKFPHLVNKRKKLQRKYVRPKKYAASPFYSLAEQVIAQKVPVSASVDQIRRTLLNNGVKPEEMRWSGIDQFLNNAQGPVSREAILEWVKNNKASINEIVRQGENTRFHKYQFPGGTNYREMLLQKQTPERFKLYREQDGRYALHDMRRGGSVLGLFDNQDEAWNYAEKLKKEEKNFYSPHWDEPNILAHARFSDRVGPNGEKLLHVDEIQSDWGQKGREQGFAGEGRINDLKEYEDRIRRLKSELMDHLRERVDYPLDYLYEISGMDPSKDWRFLQEAEKANDLPPNKLSEYAELHRAKDVVQREIRNAIPDMPHAKTWHELAMKRMIRYAAEHGYDGLTWTRGEDQGKRFGLENHFTHLFYEPNEEEGTYDITAHQVPEGGVPNHTNKVIDEDYIPADKLHEYVGHELAQKIQKGFGDRVYDENDLNSHQKEYGSPYRNWHVLTGNQMKVEAKGMRGFYDKILPDYVNKLGKRFGVKVGSTTIETNPGEHAVVHHIPITPEMRQEAVEKGHAQYQRRKYASFPTGRAIGRGMQPISQVTNNPVFTYQSKPNIIRRMLGTPTRKFYVKRLGEGQVWNIPEQTAAHNEQLIGALKRSIGLKAPETTVRTINQIPHLVSHAVPGVVNGDVTHIPQAERDTHILTDYLTGSSDRHLGNYVVGPQGLHSIDHEVAFQPSSAALQLTQHGLVQGAKGFRSHEVPQGVNQADHALRYTLHPDAIEHVLKNRSKFITAAQHGNPDFLPHLAHRLNTLQRLQQSGNRTLENLHNIEQKRPQARLSRRRKKYARLPQSTIDSYFKEHAEQGGGSKHPILRDMLEDADDPRWHIVAKHNEGPRKSFTHASNPSYVEAGPFRNDLPSMDVIHHSGLITQKNKSVHLHMPIIYHTGKMLPNPLLGHEVGEISEKPSEPEINQEYFVGDFHDPQEVKQVIRDFQRFHGAYNAEHPYFDYLKRMADVLKHHFPSVAEHHDEPEDPKADPHLFQRNGVIA